MIYVVQAVGTFHHRMTSSYSCKDYLPTEFPARNRDQTSVAIQLTNKMMTHFQLTSTEEDDEILSLGRKRDGQETSNQLESDGIIDIREIGSNILSSVH